MHITPPTDSAIRVDRGSIETALIIPQRPAGGFHFYVALFLFAWLGGWTMGLVSAGKHVLKGEGGAFLIFWLGGWSIGSLILRPGVPERVVRRSGGVAYDSGVPPFRMFFGYGFQKEIVTYRRWFFARHLTLTGLLWIGAQRGSILRQAPQRSRDNGSTEC